jgi:hypothetical protein
MTPEQRIAHLEAELARERARADGLQEIVHALTVKRGRSAGAERQDEEPSVGPFLGAPRIRLKTPEERAAAEAEHARLIEQTRQRHAQERTHREEMKAAKRAGARVYFIQQDGGERLVKIGTTTRPVEVRMREIQAAQPYSLVILAHAPGGRYEEGGLHGRFGAHRVTGEWFRPHADLLGYAANVGKAGVL